MEEEQQSTAPVTANSKITLVAGGVLVLLLITGAAFVKYQKTGQAPVDTSVQGESTVATSPTVAAGSENVQTKVFTVKGTNYAFWPSQINVKQGDKVTIVFQDDDGFHDLGIDGYNVKTQRLQTGATSELTFTADKAGNFEYFCSVDSHRQKGMKGTLTVE